MKLNILILLILLRLGSFAQHIVFSENMGATSVGASTPTARTYTGYQNYNAGNITYAAAIGSTTTIRSNSNSSSSSDYSTASGGNYAFISGNNAAYLTISNIPVSSATNLRVAFGISKTATGSDGSTLTVQITVDNNSTVSFSPALPTGSGTTQWYYITSSVSIPTGSVMAINFLNSSTDGAGNTVSYRIDDIAILSDTPLPVVFGSIEAAQKDDLIRVHWSTLKETNNDYFEVQASTDGKEFHTITTIASQNGNSDVAQNYNADINLSDLEGLLGVPVLLGFLSFGFNRRMRITICMIAGFMAIISSVSCNKSGGSINDVNAKKIFIRIKQVDVDGKYEYSKVVQVINN